MKTVITHIRKPDVWSRSSLTSAGPSIPRVSHWTPPAAKTSIHCRLTQDSGKTRPVRAARHVFVGCWTPPPRMRGGWSLQQRTAVNHLSWRCEGQRWENVGRLRASGSGFSLVSICRELRLGQRVGKSGEGCCQWEGRSGRGPGFGLGGCQMVDLRLGCVFGLRHFGGLSGWKRAGRRHLGGRRTSRWSFRLLGDDHKMKTEQWPIMTSSLYRTSELALETLTWGTGRFLETAVVDLRYVLASGWRLGRWRVMTAFEVT